MKKTFLFLTFIFLTIAPSWAQAISITESKGWLESAYIKWLPVADATSYSVYYKEASAADADYKKIDDMLIRKYAEYFRADAVGLKAGNYTMKVVPVFDETEDASKMAVSGALAVKAHVREGFAFSENSPYKTASGAYNDDGTLRPNAKVIYLTAKTAKTVQLNVVTSDKGASTLSTGLGEILSNRQKGHDTTPLAIRVVGMLTKGDMGDAVNSSGFIEVKGKNGYSELNTTIEGIGDDATLYGWGILIRQCGNVEVRNLGLMQFPEDGVSIDTKNHNIWIHNVDFFYGENKGGDKDKGDGSLDSKTSGWITISFNHFWDSGKCNLLGNGVESPEFHTYHHNWYDHSDSRHPRVRFHTVHVYNNYFDGNSKYGVGATRTSNIFVENNFFRSCRRPMLISMQGTDIAGGSNSGTFSKEDGGMIKAYGNHFEGTYTPIRDQNTSTTGFDAIVAPSRDYVVPNTYKALQGGSTYSNFDTDPSIMYTYNVQTPEDAKADVMMYAGRINGGDLKFTFNNAVEDTNSEIIPALESMVKNYKSSVLAIGFGEDSQLPDPADPNDPTNPTIPEGGTTHNFTTQGTSSSFFNIGGNTSSSYGTVSYAGLTLTQCLKMESSTNVTFTTTEPTTLTLVFNENFSGKVKINDVNYNPVAGILTMPMSAGTHSIKKGDTAYLFYINVAEISSGIQEFESSSFSLYPNPVADILHISSEIDVEKVEIYSISGVLVKSVNGDVETINLSNLNKGAYIINIKTSEGRYKQIITKK